MNSSYDSWIKRYRPVPRAKARLWCVGHAGGSAAVFRPWAERIPEAIELGAIELPGRGARRREPLMTRLDPMIDALVQVVEADRSVPLALFGHSMGALIVFELARRLGDRDGRQPLHLFVSGHGAPQLPDRTRHVHQLPDVQLREELRGLKGTPSEIFEHPELLDLMLPVIRADFELCETYAYRNGPPLACPISAFGGEEDSLVSPADLAAWREQTTGELILRVIPGGHFFVYESPEAVLSSVSQDLALSLATAV